MRQAGSDARTFVDGLDRNDFLADKRTQQAVIMSLVIVGEVVTKIMDRYPELAAAPVLWPHREVRLPLGNGAENRFPW